MNDVWAVDSAKIYSQSEGQYNECNREDIAALGFRTEFSVIGGLEHNAPPEILSLNYPADVYDVSNLEVGHRCFFLCRRA